MHSKTAPRRRHSAELKAKVLAECDAPGASVAAVAQSHGLNANLVHKWRRGRGTGAAQAAARVGESSEQAPGFVALSLPAPPSVFDALPEAASASTASTGTDIRVELRRGALGVRIEWPVSQASQCGAWLRELLR